MLQITPDQLTEFLQQPVIARVATVRRDGRPHVVPVWFHWDGSVFRFEAQLDSQKVNNLRHDPRVCVVIDSTEGGFRYRAVVMEGVAEIIEDRVVAVPIIERIFLRYLGREGVAGATAQQIIHGSRAGIVQFAPTRMTGWDRTQEEPGSHA